MSDFQKNEFDLDKQIKSKKLQRENRNLSTKYEKNIILHKPSFTIQNITQL